MREDGVRGDPAAPRVRLRAARASGLATRGGLSAPVPGAGAGAGAAAAPPSAKPWETKSVAQGLGRPPAAAGEPLRDDDPDLMEILGKKPES